MQILKVIFQFFLFVLVLSVVSFFVSREILLAIAAGQIKAEINVMRQLRSAGTYDSECMQLGSAVGSSGFVNQIQIRFTSANEYVVEVVCHGFQFDPINVASKKLPPFVVKEAGKSGLIWGEPLNGLRLQSFGREIGVYLDGETVVTNLSRVVGVELQPGPLTSCAGNSYECCHPDTEYGVGPVQSTATDCPQACYSSCRNRPIVLSFQTNPFYDLITRQVTIPNKQSVGFSYVASTNNRDEFGTDQIENGSDAVTTLMFLANKLSETWKARTATDAAETYSVQLDFGDGQQAKLSDLQGTVDHAYTCATTPCTYTAQVKVRSSKGVESTNSVISTVEIFVIQ